MVLRTSRNGSSVHWIERTDMSRKTNRQKRLQLYERGNVACPICFAAFTRDMAYGGRKVTLEHVPPKSIGGRVRCLTCRKCNVGTGRDIEQPAAIAVRPTQVTVDIMGKRGAFTLTDDGKPITTPFRQFSARDFQDLRNSDSRTFTMSVRLFDPRAVAASSLKAAYLALFSLPGSVEGYSYVRGAALRVVRQRILNPLQHDDLGNFLINAPVPCWIVKTPGRTQERFIVLTSSGVSATREPLFEWRRHAQAGAVEVVSRASWTFQTFGAFRTIRVHLEGADLVDSLVGLKIHCTLPDGRPERGTCIRHVGENATLLCSVRRP